MQIRQVMILARTTWEEKSCMGCHLWLVIMGTFDIYIYIYIYNRMLVVNFPIVLMDSLAASKKNSLKVIIWKYVIRYSTQLFVPLFLISLGLVLQGHLLPAVDFVSRHRDCLFDIALFPTLHIRDEHGVLQVATTSQVASSNIRTFAAIMTTR